MCNGLLESHNPKEHYKLIAFATPYPNQQEAILAAIVL
jgi:hypothetical protein